jgi:hypothetical protein
MLMKFVARILSRILFRVIKSKRMRWEEHVASMGETRGFYRDFVGRADGKSPLGKPRHRWKDNIRIDLREIWIDGANWIQLDQVGVRRRASLITVINLRIR